MGTKFFFFCMRNVTHVPVDLENVIAYLSVNFKVKNTDSRVCNKVKIPCKVITWSGYY
jgi:hypothetical protein